MSKWLPVPVLIPSKFDVVLSKPPALNPEVVIDPATPEAPSKKEPDVSPTPSLSKVSPLLNGKRMSAFAFGEQRQQRKMTISNRGM